MPALILPLITLVWEIVKAIFFNKSSDPNASVTAAIDKFRDAQAKILAGIKKAEDTEGDTSDVENEINHRKP